uniref:Ig-like domain-containing protein n=1 Tax=Balaenoptera musculus TaxID=9771 RepID=A0A8C0DHT7_BALMU
MHLLDDDLSPLPGNGICLPVLTQPSSLSAYPGASARLTCTLSSGFNVGDFWICWYQQKPGNPPRYLLTFHSDSDKYQGIPDRSSGSTSVNTASLTILGLQPEDKADYYCSTWDDSISGNTAHLTHGELRQKPTPSPRDHPRDCL